MHFDWILLPKAYKDLDEKIQKSYVSWHWRVSKVWRKTDAWFQKWHEEVTSGKSENLHFDVLLFSIAFKVSAKKVQKNYLSWYWKKIQTLKKNSLFVWKMTWENWWTLTRTVESLKTCTLMGYLCRKYVMFEQKKIQRNCAVKNDLYMVSKMTYVIWWIFTLVAESKVR